jgi:hypothetical protein
LYKAGCHRCIVNRATMAATHARVSTVYNSSILI